jgi:hypothetical protein
MTARSNASAGALRRAIKHDTRRVILIYIKMWKYGLQFDVQRKRRWDARGNYSFIGHLWCWDYRHPFCLTRQD